MIPSDGPLTLRSGSAETTRAVAAVVARHLAAGDLVALTGELGAGKTCFVQGAASELGVRDGVRSPSFMLRRDYEGRIGITHLDVYRLDTLDEVADLGHDDPSQRERVTFVEWGDAIRPLLPGDHLEIEFHLPPPEQLRAAGGGPGGGTGASSSTTPEVDAEPRTLVLRPHGRAWRQRMDALTADCRRWATP